MYLYPLVTTKIGRITSLKLQHVQPWSASLLGPLFSRKPLVSASYNLQCVKTR